MNRLQHETSPYLLQHAHNPVDWFAWRPEAFERAAEEDKPLLVSIGYSTCHWCHVMERESFEDDHVAEYMNTHFINIKVDREERPDIDQIYMEACQVMTGAGGWPLHVFCTPDGKPFYAGTYFPPRPIANRPSWLQVLHSMNRSWREKRSMVEEQSNRLLEYVAGAGKKLLDLGPEAVKGDGPSQDDLKAVVRTLMSQADHRNGGFGNAPKFPQVSNLRFLIRAGDLLGLEEPEGFVHLTLEKMIRGGVYDQIGGGLMRYATDQAWRVPHFEKMLYDNAALLEVLAEAWQLKQNPLYLETIRQTLEFLEREMCGPDGGFYSALDADSEGKEGAFYVWDEEELKNVLGSELKWVADYYGIRPEGNWEGTNILMRPESDDAFLARWPDLKADWPDRRSRVQASMLEVRSGRIRPGLDDKYLLDWNAMMLAALSAVYQATGLEKARELALQNLQFLRTTFAGGGPDELMHAYTDRSESGAAFRANLDDYAHYIRALLAVYPLSWDLALLREAGQYTEYLLTHFLDPESDLFYFTASETMDIPVRRHDIFDSSTPSGNSVMARNLLRLGLLLDRDDFREQAQRMLMRTLEPVKKYSGALANWGIALTELIYPASEVVLVGPNAPDFAGKILRRWDPNRILMATAEVDEGEEREFPLLTGRAAADNSTLIYLCENYACQKPVETLEEYFEMTKE